MSSPGQTSLLKLFLVGMRNSSSDLDIYEKIRKMHRFLDSTDVLVCLWQQVAEERGT